MRSLDSGARLTFDQNISSVSTALRGLRIATTRTPGPQCEEMVNSVALDHCFFKPQRHTLPLLSLHQGAPSQRLLKSPGR